MDTLKLWKDFIVAVIETSYQEWANAVDELWTGAWKALTDYASYDFWKSAVVVFGSVPGVFNGAIAAMAYIVVHPWDLFFAGLNTFTSRVRTLPIRVLIRSVGRILPVPSRLRQKVMALDDVARLLITWTVEGAITVITTPPPWWVTLAKSIKKKWKWIDLAAATTIGKAVGLGTGYIIDFVVLLIGITVALGTSISILLMLWLLGETLGDEAKTAALFKIALPQDSEKVKITGPVTVRYNRKKGVDFATTKTPKFL